MLVFLLEIAGGYLTNSLALLSDAFHALTDTIELLTVIAVEYLVTRKSFGDRIRAYGGIISSLLLGLTGLFIFYEAVQRYFRPMDILTFWMLVIAVIGLAGNLAAMIILRQSDETHITQTSAVYHIISDTLSSLMVIFAGTVIHFTGAVIFDPIVSSFVSIFILWRCLKLFRTSFTTLKTPS